MKLVTLLSLGVFACSLALSTAPVAAFEVAPPEIDDGPGIEGPDEIEAPDFGGGPGMELPVAPPDLADAPGPAPAPGGNGGHGGGEGGNHASPSTLAGGGGLCLFGRWVTTYHADANGQPIPGTMERTCMRRVQN